MQANPNHIWRASGGRRIRVCQMSPEHLINTLNFLERGTNWPPRDADDAQRRADDYYYLRCEAWRRGIRWKGWANKAPLYDGELGGFVSGSHQCAPPTSDVQEFIGREVTCSFTRARNASSESDGRFSVTGELESVSTNLRSKPDDDLRLYQIKVGEQFRKLGDSTPYVRVDPIGEIWRAIHARGYTQVDGAFVCRDSTPRYIVTNLRTGRIFFEPGYLKVVRLELP